MRHANTIAAALCIFIYGGACGGAAGADVLSETQARAKAAAILQGDPYGRTKRAAADKIKEAHLVTSGTICDMKVRLPVWQFRVVVRENTVSYGNPAIDGILTIDGRTGKLICAGLPFLD